MAIIMCTSTGHWTKLSCCNHAFVVCTQFLLRCVQSVILLFHVGIGVVDFYFLRKKKSFPRGSLCTELLAIFLLCTNQAALFVAHFLNLEIFGVKVIDRCIARSKNAN